MNKYIVGLDLSTKCSGYALFNFEGNLIDFQKIKPKTTLSTLGKIDSILNGLYLLLSKNSDYIKKIVIEDIYLGYFRGANQVKGFATLARLSGAVIADICSIIPDSIDDLIILRNASEARPLVKLKGNCQKAEVQVWALKNFTDIDISNYECLIEAIKAKKQVKDIPHKVYKDRMNKISKLIEQETDFDENI